ncbi:MAG TPA: M14 family zinc carboxypeptidase [Pyrinomonadaceae bacterium]|nr:M14 family zinc carboxypeptidase [Pyrinomonadaceae bacterium]
MTLQFGRTLILAALLICLALASSTQAQTSSTTSADAPFDFYARGPYRETVPRPQSILGYDVGAFHTNYAMMERVVSAIAQAAPDRMRVTDMGHTNEHRMMHLLVLSSPENLLRLAEIKANVARLADPRTLSPQEAERIAASTPVVVWLNYTIHGDETASFEAMMQVVYQLAASNEPATLEVLKNCVVLINCCANPDGHERFVAWYNSISTGNPEPQAAEHRQPWSVYGRYNRFRFDLNRDNIASTQVETRNMERAFLEWNPQVFVDHHGQPSQFFFPPAAQPINPNLPSAQTARWLTEFGRANAAQFDQRRWDYYVRDIFDLFYPGYWDSWPALNGATGMTYETDGGGWKGINWRRDDDTIVTLRSGAAKHFIASLTTLETAGRNRSARLADYYEFRRTAIEEGRTGPMRRVVIPFGPDVVKTTELAEVLLRAGIEVKISREAFRSASAHNYTDPEASATARVFQSGAIVIDMEQPQKRLAKALLEPQTPQDARFVQEQLARFARNERRGRNASKEEYSFYDITSWSLPLAFGLEAYWTEDAASFQHARLRLAPQAAVTDAERKAIAERGEYLTSWLLSDNYNTGVIQGRASVAYIIPYDRDGAASLVYRLEREGYRVSVATRQLTAGGRDWPRGTMVVRVSRNPESLHEAVARLSREAGVMVTAVNSGFNETGETGVGSENVVALKQPRILVVADEGVEQSSYGAIWWLFERFRIDWTPMTINSLKNAQLDRYNVIILPDGSPDRYYSAFGKAGADTLRGWAERGGTLVCIKGAAVFAALKDIGLTSSRLVGSDEDDQKGSPEAEETEAKAEANGQASANDKRRERSAAQKQQEQTQPEAPAQTEKLEGAPPELPPIASPSARPGQVPEAVPGAVMRATVDRTTYLTYGYEVAELPVLVNSGYFFRPSKEGTNAVVFGPEAGKGLHLSGFIWPNNTERLLRGTAYVIDEPTGRGHVILYAEDPQFRGIWRSMTRLFFNSILFAPSLS